MSPITPSISVNEPNPQAAIQTLSVVVPIYNEVDSIPHLVESIATILRSYQINYEIICVDDGSKDGSTEVLTNLAKNRDDLKAVILRRNYGQTPAMAAGFNYATGQVIVTLDGDLQNDPNDIPLLLAKLEEGYDLVSGWRKNRQDDRVKRLLPSKIANWLIAKVTGVKLHDYGCSLKAYRAELVADMNLYGELHRFLPALAFIEGAKITEIPVNHHARRFGQSKYGLGRTIRVIMDLFTVFFYEKVPHPSDAHFWILRTFIDGSGDYFRHLSDYSQTRFRTRNRRSTFVNPGCVILFNWGTITLFWSFGRNFDANLP